MQMNTPVAAGNDITWIDRCNVVWDSPSLNAAGSMPIGNGEVGLNVWVEADGDLLFYISRTDSWSECNRLLKLGRIRVSLSPNPFVAKAPLSTRKPSAEGGFQQELKLRDGQIVINAGDTMLRVLVDADAPVIYVTGASETPRIITATFETWRAERRQLVAEELDSSRTMGGAPASIEVWESPDIVSANSPDAVLWYHRNEESIVPITLKHQGLESLAGLVKDPLLHRTFGGRMSGAGFAKATPSSLKTAQAVSQFTLSIATHVSQTKSAADWERDIPQPGNFDTVAETTAAWWNEFWNRSWIFVEEAADLPESPPPTHSSADSNGASAGLSRITQAYVLQRWITACGGRGRYPIKFNGSIFTVEPKFAGGPDFNADWRRWGDCFWWQNTRLPYFPMIARGDFDEVRTLFNFYGDALPLCRARAKLYHGVAGAYFPETMTIFGAYANGDYGWDRQDHQPNEVLSPYWRYAWQQGLELVVLMLDFYEYTQDKQFLNDELIPMAREVLDYYDTRFKRDEDGKLIISPTQSVETYWHEVVNDTPSVAGLIDVCNRLLALPAAQTEREFWAKMKAAIPALPIKEGRVQPAEKFNPQRNNCENPELYAIWPFRLYGVGSPNLDVGIATFQGRHEKASFGWQYDGQSAAIVGLADDAKRILQGKIGNAHAGFRFPVMWGPNYDWLPDQDHGGNIMLTLQAMVMQADGDKIHVLPAWPKNWNVSFKLHAPKQTVVEGVYRGGKLEHLKVTPESRRKDTII